jgi:glutathione S-transferase
MKLYYSPGACSLSPHIVLREAGLPVSLVKVDLRGKQTADGIDFRTVNSKGYVPVLELDDGQRLTEGPAIVQYIADKVPSAGLVPPAGTLERYRVQEWLSFISTELHKQYSPLFDPASDDALKTRQRERLATRMAWVAQQLGTRDYLMGAGFTVADAYLFAVLSWSPLVALDLSPWPALGRYVERVAARPKVREAMQAEGLLKAA